MMPDQFWRLHPREFWLIAEARKQPEMYGSMTEDRVRELYEDAYGPS